MAVFNITLHWDKNATSLDCTDNVERFIHQIKCIYEGLNFSEKNEKYQIMITKFLPIMINVSAQFPELFLPAVDERLVCFIGLYSSVQFVLLQSGDLLKSI